MSDRQKKAVRDAIVRYFCGHACSVQELKECENAAEVAIAASDAKLVPPLIGALATVFDSGILYADHSDAELTTAISTLAKLMNEYFAEEAA